MSCTERYTNSSATGRWIRRTTLRRRMRRSRYTSAINSGFHWVGRWCATRHSSSPITFDYAGNGYLLVNEQLHKYDPNLNQWNLLEEDLSNLLWQGGDPIKFRMNDFWYFGLFSYNGRYLESLASYRNMMLEFNCQLAGY